MIGSPACALASRHNHPAMTTAKSRATRTRMGASSDAGQSTPARLPARFSRQETPLMASLGGNDVGDAINGIPGETGRPLLQRPDDAHTDALGGFAAKIEKNPAHVELHANRHRVARHVVHQPAALQERSVRFARSAV